MVRRLRLRRAEMVCSEIAHSPAAMASATAPMATAAEIHSRLAAMSKGAAQAAAGHSAPGARTPKVLANPPADPLKLRLFLRSLVGLIPAAPDSRRTRRITLEST